MHWWRNVHVEMILDNGFLFFLGSFTKYKLFSLHDIIDLPIYLLAIIIKAFQVRADVSNNLSGLIFLYQHQIGENVEDFLNKILCIEVFLLHHEFLSHFLDTAFGGCNFLVYKLIENISKQISTKHIALHIYLLATN